jgi:YVTN family beta-propeller protein
VVVIDSAKKRLLQTIPIAPGALSVAITPDGKKLYVANSSSDSVSVIDTSANMVVKTITVGFGTHPTDVSVAADGHFVYASNSQDNTTSVIDTTTDNVSRMLSTGSVATRVAVLRQCSQGVVGSRDGSKVYVVSNQYNSVSDPTGLFDMNSQ